MSYKIKISKRADKEIIEIASYYKNENINLKNRFIIEIKSIIRNLKSNPNIYSIRFDDIRRANLNKFPYGVYYSISEDNKLVIIKSVFHNSRNNLNI